MHISKENQRNPNVCKSSVFLVCYSVGQYLTRRKYDVNEMSLSLNTDFQRSGKFDPLRENTILLSLSLICV